MLTEILESADHCTHITPGEDEALYLANDRLPALLNQEMNYSNP